jgi:phosphohistidine phosphatase
MILRHAKAVPWGSTSSDFSRPLNQAGTAHAEAVARWIDATLDFPGMVLCSPSQRTRETLAPIIESRAQMEQRTRFLPQLYGASFGTLVNILDHAFAEHDSVLVVGHNPGLEHLMFETIAQSQHDSIKRLATGTLVVIGLDPDWAEAQGQGKIEHNVRGKKLLA